MSHRIKNIALAAAGSLLFAWLLTTGLWRCPVKTLFGVNCPTCGMTTAFQALFRLDIKTALTSNLFFVPLTLLLIFLQCCFLYGALKNIDILSKIEGYLHKHFKAVLWIIAVAFLINNLELIPK